MGRKNQVLLLAERIARDLVAEQTKARLMMGFDAAIFAAHEVFGMGAGRAGAYANAYTEAMERLASLYIDDAAESGKGIEYAKAQRDEAIRRNVGEENFVAFDAAYGAAYVDELKRFRIMSAGGQQD